MPQDDAFETLTLLLSRLPGLGKRSARRAVLHLIKHKEILMLPLAEAISETAETILECDPCGNLSTEPQCRICQSPKRASGTLCIVEEVSDLWAIERSGAFVGRYHVLGGTLSAIDGRGPEDLRLASLPKRIAEESITEVILATNATVDGQTTAHYITEWLKDEEGLTISRIAHGIPIGGELDYLDEGTLGTALQSRRPF